MKYPLVSLAKRFRSKPLKLRPNRILRAAPPLLLGLAALAATQAMAIQPVCSVSGSAATLARTSASTTAELASCIAPIGTAIPATAMTLSQIKAPELIVIGFMGGRVKGDNFIHKEALLARQLQETYPQRLYAAVFANHDADNAFRAVMKRLDQDRDGQLSAAEKSAARIVIYGHSWGASETVALARRLNTLGIPVLLTIQVDSVQKPNESDGLIPPNVHEAINFYQTEGLLHGRPTIAAADPSHTTILGNYQSSYRDHPVSCQDYPWFARTFMKSHIEIENDPSVWGKIATLIRTRLPQ
jgi:hypothetical protein